MMTNKEYIYLKQKKCNKCQIVKDVEDFYRKRTSCKTCTKQYQAEWNKKDVVKQKRRIREQLPSYKLNAKKRDHKRIEKNILELRDNYLIKILRNLGFGNAAEIKNYPNLLLLYKENLKLKRLCQKLKM